MNPAREKLFFNGDYDSRRCTYLIAYPPQLAPAATALSGSICKKTLFGVNGKIYDKHYFTSGCWFNANFQPFIRSVKGFPPQSPEIPFVNSDRRIHKTTNFFRRHSKHKPWPKVVLPVGLIKIMK